MSHPITVFGFGFNHVKHVSECLQDVIVKTQCLSAKTFDRFSMIDLKEGDLQKAYDVVDGLESAHEQFITQHPQESRAQDMPAEYREAALDFMNTDADVINLPRLVPFIPLNKVDASRNPGKLIPNFKYRCEYLKKAVFTGHKTLNVASAAGNKVKVIVPCIEVMKYAIQEMTDDLDSGLDAEVTSETKVGIQTARKSSPLFTIEQSHFVNSSE
ncbi:hypothetical protein K501DRAFT_275075 [Backusella circina FSU 941]|nr:hypothetical protein K501DRAFT_275075 [Backusella circina FSU 941]